MSRTHDFVYFHFKGWSNAFWNDLIIQRWYEFINLFLLFISNTYCGCDVIYMKQVYFLTNGLSENLFDSIYMNTFKELFYWFEFKDIQILLYIAAFRTKVKAEKGELQFQDMSWSYFLLSTNSPSWYLYDTSHSSPAQLLCSVIQHCNERNRTQLLQCFFFCYLLDFYPVDCSGYVVFPYQGSKTDVAR